MNTTRKTIWTARLVVALTTVAAYLWTGVLYDILLDAGHNVVLLAVLGGSAAICLWDGYNRMFADYRARIALLGAAVGVAAATVAVVMNQALG